MIPKTPNRFSNGFALATPQTPRYGPLEDPDVPRKLFKVDDGEPDREVAHLTQEEYDNDKRVTEPANVKTIMGPLTPADTPINRKRTIEAIGGVTNNSTLPTSRVLFPRTTPVRGSGRTYHSRQSPIKKRPHFNTNNLDTIEPPLDNNLSSSSARKHNFEIFDDLKAFRRDANNEDPFVQAPKRASVVDTLSQKHPHVSMPLDVPGMWYVFRGKKIFRPFAKGDDSLSSIKPKRLFATTTGSGSANGSINIAPSDSEDDTDYEELPPARRKLDFLAAKAIPAKLDRKKLV